MATTLLDALKKSQQETLTPSSQNLLAPTGGEETAQTANLLQVGQTGKQLTSGPAPRMSSIQERLANLQTKLGTDALKEQVQTKQIATAQEDEVAQKEAQIQDESLEEKRQQSVEQFNRQVSSVLDNYRTQNRQLDLNKDKSRMEQIGFQLRLGNAKYVSDLKREGARSRLTSKAKMNEEIARTVFADEQELFANDLSFRSMLGQKGRDLSESLSNISLDMAIKLADSQASQANQAMMWQSVGTGVSAGTQAYAKYGGRSTAPESTQVSGVNTEGGPDTSGLA